MQQFRWWVPLISIFYCLNSHRPMWRAPINHGKLDGTVSTTQYSHEYVSVSMYQHECSHKYWTLDVSHFEPSIQWKLLHTSSSSPHLKFFSTHTDCAHYSRNDIIPIQSFWYTYTVILIATYAVILMQVCRLDRENCSHYSHFDPSYFSQCTNVCPLHVKDIKNLRSWSTFGGTAKDIEDEVSKTEAYLDKILIKLCAPLKNWEWLNYTDIIVEGQLVLYK